jgi:hypothetical protein
MTEPEVIHCRHAEGVTVIVRDEFIRLTAWIDLEVVPDGERPERRIIARLALPNTVARALIRDLRRAVARGGH